MAGRQVEHQGIPVLGRKRSSSGSASMGDGGPSVRGQRASEARLATARLTIDSTRTTLATISFQLAPDSLERVAFAYGPWQETVFSLHVLVTPQHHPLHHPFIRRMRSLPVSLRRELAALSFAFGAAPPSLGTHLPNPLARFPTDTSETFHRALEEFRALPEDTAAGGVRRGSGDRRAAPARRRSDCPDGTRGAGGVREATLRRAVGLLGHCVRARVAALGAAPGPPRRRGTAAAACRRTAGVRGHSRATRARPCRRAEFPLGHVLRAPVGRPEPTPRRTSTSTSPTTSPSCRASSRGRTSGTAWLSRGPWA